MNKFKTESLKSRYRIMICYLHFLYSQHINLELEIILVQFQGKERRYHRFIEGILSPESAAPLCEEISFFLRHRGYPTSFIEHKVARVSN